MNIHTEYDATLHGTSGPIKVTLANKIYATAQKLIAAAGQVVGFQYNGEPNGPNQLGISWSQMNQGVSSDLSDSNTG